MKNETANQNKNTQIKGSSGQTSTSNLSDSDHRLSDNKNQYEQENSANGIDSVNVSDGQEGRNDRAIASTDMDTQNGVLRMGDNANSTLEVTNEGLENAVASALKTNTATVDVKKNKSSDKPDTSQTSKKSKKQTKKSVGGNSTKTQKEREEDIAETGTDLDNRPVY